jgi:hypothetical protein
MMEFFCLPLHPDWLWGPLSLLSDEYGGLFSWGVKHLGYEADHLPPSSAESSWCGA